MPAKPKRAPGNGRSGAVKKKGRQSGSAARKKARPAPAAPRKNETRTIQKMKTRKSNLLKIYAEMNRMCIDAVDKEVLKRFKVIIDTIEEDITKKSMYLVLRDPRSVAITDFSEIIQPYIKHYLFLAKRIRRDR